MNQYVAILLQYKISNKYICIIKFTSDFTCVKLFRTLLSTSYIFKICEENLSVFLLENELLLINDFLWYIPSMHIQFRCFVIEISSTITSLAWYFRLPAESRSNYCFNPRWQWWQWWLFCWHIYASLGVSELTLDMLSIGIANVAQELLCYQNDTF